MPVLRVNDRQHDLKPGRTRLGGGADVDLAISSDDRLGVQAVIEVSDHVIIRRAGAGVVKVNGVPLGAEPTPLMHGDKVEVGGQELLFSEDAKVGTTRYVNRDDIAGVMPKRAGARPTTSTGGRLVSLVDGKEYVVRPTGVTIGRDASCDVVVAQNEVSRRHAEIVPSDRGYMIHDHSTNGVYVNGARVQQSQLLARSDVVRIGSEEFRFYADVIPPGPGAPAPAVAPAAAPAAASRAAPPPGTGAIPPAPAAASAPAVGAAPVSPLAGAPVSPLAGAPVAAGAPSATAGGAPNPVGGSVATERVTAVPESPATADATRPVLATLEVLSEGASKGKRFELRVPLAHVGRGAYNDVAIDDDSVSDAHAKLQRRDDGWYLIDLGSTNGSYAAGSRVMHERRLDGSPDLRFGAVKQSFNAAAAPVVVGKGTRAMASMTVDRGRPIREPKTIPARPQPPAPAPSTGLSAWVWFLILAAAAAVAFYLLKS